MHSVSFRFSVIGLVGICIVLNAPRESVLRAQTNPTIVLYAGDGAVSGTRWAVVADTQAAGGSAIFNANKSEAKLTTALAAPASYAELTFTAPANVAYHLWLRMKAQDNYYGNDSVFVQFSDSLNLSGAADFRIGTTRAMDVVLEEASGAGLSAWGWADNGYGSLGVNVKFGSTGVHTVRIQQREDGATIDQVVLSDSTYLAKAPGTAKADTTILPANDGSVPTTPPPGDGAGPFKVATWNIRSGEGRCPITGTCPFTDSTQNCTDPNQPMNAWGHNIPQQELGALGQDPSVIAIGLQEAWVCGQASNVKRVLNWAYASPTYDGTALIARYGIYGTHDYRLLYPAADSPAYVIGADVCVDAACSATLRVYVAHLFFNDPEDRVVDPEVLTEAQTMLGWIATRPHADKHILTGDLNAFEREPAIDFPCERTFDYQAPKFIRDSGYTDAWLALHGTTPGMTATLNRNGCGTPIGGPWKRIDYGYLKGLTPTSSSLFGVVPANTPAPSDHYGLITGFDGVPDRTPLSPPPGSIITLPAGEILLRAADDTAPRTAGRWAITSDATADGGKRWTNADLGDLKVAAPLAAPSNYFDVTFTAPAGAPYHLWLRMRAQNNSYSNDSVFVQFSDSLSAGGGAAYRMGTGSALTVILENGSGAGVSDWGWADDGYGTLGTTVTFATSGTHTIRIQQREDGVSIDQILLSPKTYLTTAPGTTKNDTHWYAPASSTPPSSGGLVTLPADEILLRAADDSSPALVGRWAITSDSTADGGKQWTNADLGEAKVATALAAPRSYFDVAFTAPAGTPYHLWLRMRAQNNSYANDSVFVQFSDSLNAAHAAADRIGTTDALVVILEDGSGAGVSGWGWADDGYGTLGTTVTFATSGTHTIRIQQREDGAGVDQILLSPKMFLATAPGATKNDTTLYAATQQPR